MPRRWKCYKCHRSVRVTDIPHSGKHSSGCSSWLCKVWCSLVLAFGCDFSVSSTISHRELVKSSACRLPALISWNVKMCFSAAVIIILGTQAQTNPQLRSEKKGMRKAECFSDSTYVCISTMVLFEGGKKGKRDDMLGQRVRWEKKKHQQISLSTLNVCYSCQSGIFIVEKFSFFPNIL